MLAIGPLALSFLCDHRAGAHGPKLREDLAGYRHTRRLPRGLLPQGPRLVHGPRPSLLSQRRSRPEDVNSANPHHASRCRSRRHRRRCAWRRSHRGSRPSAALPSTRESRRGVAAGWPAGSDSARVRWPPGEAGPQSRLSRRGTTRCSRRRCRQCGVARLFADAVLRCVPRVIPDGGRRREWRVHAGRRGVAARLAAGPHTSPAATHDCCPQSRSRRTENSSTCPRPPCASCRPPRTRPT